jgi:NAD(P)-dependent dehydrogenase (short-subunit alcohol dehydrogenase family)
MNPERIALVSGSSSGIGAAIVELLAAEGCLRLINACSDPALQHPA